MFLTTNLQTLYNNAIISKERRWKITKFYVYKNEEWVGLSYLEFIKSFTISDYSTENSNITMGCFAGSKLTLNLMEVPSSLLQHFSEGNRVQIELTVYRDALSDLRKASLQSSAYIIDSLKIKKRKNGRNDLTIVGYDLSYSMTKKYSTSLENTSALNIVEEIANKYGLGVDDSVNTAISDLGSEFLTHQFSIQNEFTDKQTIAYLAGCFGCFARINHLHKIEFVWYTKSASPEIDNSRIFYDGATYSTDYTVSLIETGTKDNPIVYPENASGYSINYENPYIVSAMASQIFDKKIANNAISYKTGKIKYRGSPNDKPGTIVNIRDDNGKISSFYIMKRTLVYDGGVSETIECMGESETTINYKVTSPTQQKIDRLYSRMEEAIKEATDIITQTKGSIFEFVPVDENDPSKGNSGWKLYSTEFGNRNVILANSSGIGFSSNGGQSFDAAAIYIDENGQGHINGNYITAGSISADKIDTSQLVVGGNIDTSTLESLLNDVVDTANSNISSVDVLYAKNQSQTVAPPVSEFTTEPPVWEEGYFIWTLTKTVSGGVANYSDPVCITGASGSTGVGISNVINYYLATNLSSGVTPDTSGWTVEVQSTTLTLKYLWNYEEVVYTNGTSQLTEPAIIGTYGRSISSRAEKYATSTSYNNVPNIDKDFSYNIPQLDPINKYLWNVEYTYYTDGTAGHTDPVVIGVYGDTGAEGATGADGQSVKDIEEQYYLSTSSTTQTGGSWSTAQPTWSSGKYIWTRSKITWENPTATTYTTPVLAKAINGANSTASSAQSTANTANTNATNALSVANTANGKVASWCHANDTTLIDGAKIFTGSITAMQIAAGSITADKLAVGAITAEKVNVGWQSGNCATGWSSDYSSYVTVTSDSSYGNNPKITMSSSYTSGNIDVNGTPFYASAGDVLRFGGRAYKRSTGDNGVYLKYSSKSDGTYSVVSYGNTSSQSTGTITDIDKSYTVTNAGWYMITVAFNRQSSGAYVTNLYCYKDVKGEMIVNGKISSVDKNTYFDLDNSVLATNDARITGGYIQIGGDDYYTRIESGELYQSLLSSNGIVGGLTITSAESSSSYFQTLYYQQGNGISFSKYNGSSGFVELSRITTSGITNSVTSYCQSSDFAGFVHTRNSAIGGTVKFGVGNIVDRMGDTVASAALELSDGGKVAARLDVIPSWGSAKGVIYVEDDTGRSAPLELGTSDMWFNGKAIIATIQSLLDEANLSWS